MNNNDNIRVDKFEAKVYHSRLHLSRERNFIHTIMMSSNIETFPKVFLKE